MRFVIFYEKEMSNNIKLEGNLSDRRLFALVGTMMIDMSNVYSATEVKHDCWALASTPEAAQGEIRYRRFIAAAIVLQQAERNVFTIDFPGSPARALLKKRMQSLTYRLATRARDVSLEHVIELAERLKRARHIAGELARQNPKPAAEIIQLAAYRN